MNISIVGSGNVATVLARLCYQKNHNINQIIARNEEEGKKLALSVNADLVNFSGVINRVDIVIVALSDNALPEAIEEINFVDNIIVHTAGAVSMHVLRRKTKNYGVLYPLQTLKKEIERIPVIPILIEAINDKTTNIVKAFAETISDSVQFVAEEKRFNLHVAAVLANNFTNYLYTVTHKFCDAELLDFNLLKPLIVETALRIEDGNPLDVQTGPAKRNDFVTLEKHLRILSKYPKIRTLYTRMTDGIMND
jgi:predicted short-subunit dehydrogenase-like oxidoreductase (DUF2520 family)